MEIQAYIAALVGIAVLSGVIVFLALRLRSSQRALRIGQGRAAAILDAAVDGIITIDEDGLIESFNRRRTSVRLSCGRGPGPECPTADAGTVSLRV